MTTKDRPLLRKLAWLKANEIGVLAGFSFSQFNWHVLARLIRSVTTPYPKDGEDPFVTACRNAIYRTAPMPACLENYNPGTDEREMFLTQEELEAAE